MDWNAVRQAYPDRWLIVEALEAHSEDNQRQLDRLAVVEECRDGAAAFQRYQALHQQYAERELDFVHTAREQLTSLVRQRIGIPPLLR